MSWLQAIFFRFTAHNTNAECGECCDKAAQGHETVENEAQTRLTSSSLEVITTIMIVSNIISPESCMLLKLIKTPSVDQHDNYVIYLHRKYVVSYTTIII